MTAKIDDLILYWLLIIKNLRINVKNWWYDVNISRFDVIFFSWCQNQTIWRLFSLFYLLIENFALLLIFFCLKIYNEHNIFYLTSKNNDMTSIFHAMTSKFRDFTSYFFVTKWFNDIFYIHPLWFEVFDDFRWFYIIIYDLSFKFLRLNVKIFGFT